MSLAAWMARAGALGKKSVAGLEDLVRGKETFQLGRPAGFDMPRMGGLLGEGGGAEQLGEKMHQAGDKLGAGADQLEAFLAAHPNLVAGGAGLLGGGVGGAAYLASQDGSEEPDDDEAMKRHRRGGMD